MAVSRSDSGWSFQVASGFWQELLNDPTLARPLTEISLRSAILPLPENTGFYAPPPSGQASGRPYLTLALSLGAETGRGEAAPATWLGAEGIATVTEELQRWITTVERAKPSLSELFSFPTVLSSASAVAAIDCALLDLTSRLLGCSVASLLRASTSDAAAEGDGLATQLYQAVPVSALLVADSADQVALEVSEALQSGARGVKLKVGALSVDVDRARINAALTALQSGSNHRRLRLDANRRWTHAQAVQTLCDLDSRWIEVVEEPLLEATPASFAALRAEIGLPLGLDESIVTAHELTPWLAQPSFEFLVVKQQRMGGLRNSFELARRAKRAGAKVIVTDSIEGAVGSAAAVHLAAAIDDQPCAVGLGGNALRFRQQATAWTHRALGPGLAIGGGGD